MTDSEMTFQALPKEWREHLLATHLRTHMQMVEDLTDDVAILHKRLIKASGELKEASERIEKLERENGTFRLLVSRHKLNNALSQLIIERRKEVSNESAY